MTDETIDIWDMTKVNEQQYTAMLAQLKKNEENVPRDLLRTKYQTGYNRLRQELKEATCRIMKEAVCCGLLIRKDNADTVFVKINQLIKESGAMEEISQAVYRHYDIDRITGLIMILRMRIHDEAERRPDDGRQEEKYTSP